MISGSCFGQGESNFRHPGVEKLLMNSAEYGFVMDNQCGTVLKTSFSDGKLILTVTLKEVIVINGRIKGNVLRGMIKEQKFELSFNDDGSASGSFGNGQPMFIVRGKKTTDGETISYTKSQGMPIGDIMTFARKNKFPAHDAIGYYSYREWGYMFNTYIFKTGFRHYSYGYQPKVRTFIAKKNNGQWSFWEDNSNFH